MTEKVILILVVDDEVSLCELIAAILAEYYQVLKAYNGQQALALARTHKPTLVVSDVMMPHMTGLELLEALRAEEVTADIPVILLSAATPKSLAVKADAFLTKPFELKTLEKVVSRFVQARLKAQRTLHPPVGVEHQQPRNDARAESHTTINRPLLRMSSPPDTQTDQEESVSA